MKLDDDIYALAEKLKHLGIKSYDALHLCCAKKAGADVLLSTDDKLVKKSQKNKDVLDITVDNPLNWLRKIW
ncbi:MAG: PIN domain-containing protein [Candidatus Electrothrix sp. YB6]